MACRLLASGLRRYRNLRVFESQLSAVGVLHEITEIRPDILLVGTNLAGPLTGFALAREIRKSHPTIAVVVLLENSHKALVVEAFRSGAKGVFCRSEFDFKALWKCVSAVKHGQVWANSEQLRFLIDSLGEATPMHLVDSAGLGLLTPREEQVVRQVAEGLTNREIGEHLQLSEHTVKNYLFRIFDKLGISKRVELAMYAFESQKRPPIAEPSNGNRRERVAANRSRDLYA